MDEEDPDENFWIGFFNVRVENSTRSNQLINFLLKEVESKKRARVIIHKNHTIISGVWTPEEATSVSLRLRISIGGTFEDPLLIRGVLRPLQYLGLIQ